MRMLLASAFLIAVTLMLQSCVSTISVPHFDTGTKGGALKYNGSLIPLNPYHESPTNLNSNDHSSKPKSKGNGNSGGGGSSGGSENTNAVCGNGKVESGEECDTGINNGAICTPLAGSSCQNCTTDCKIATISNNSSSSSSYKLAGFTIPGDATYYVSATGSDSNNGKSSSSAFKTIQKASSVAKPGDTVMVMDGTYSGGIVTSASGNSTSRILYFSQHKWGAKIDGTGNTKAWENSGAYVDIAGFDIFGSEYYGIDNLASYDRIIGNHVHNLKPTQCDSNGGAGIDIEQYTTREGQVLGNVVNNIQLPGNAHCGTIQGIYVATYGDVVKNNIVYNISDTAIHPWHYANNITIANNLVFNSYVGILIAGGSVTIDNSTVTNNIIINTQYALDNNGMVGTHNTYKNNILYNNSVNYYQLATGNTPQNTIFTNPSLVNYKIDGSGNYHLSSSSPAINTGTTLGAPSYDIDSTSRPQGNGIDIGPYEYQGTVKAVCGDGIIQSGEACDNGSNNGVVCYAAYGNSCTYCDSKCAIKTYTNSTTPPTPPASQISYNIGYQNAARTSSYTNLSGASLTGQYYISVYPSDNISSVEFYLDGSYYNTETITPYDFNGTNNPTDVNGLGAGTHTIKVSINATNGSVINKTATFTVQQIAQSIPKNAYLAKYYNGMNFDTLVTTRQESAINYDWGTSAPLSGVNNNNFSVIWEENFSFDKDNYTFSTVVDDGVKVYVDGNLIISAWHDQGPTYYEGNLSLSAG